MTMLPSSSVSSERSTTFTACQAATCRSSPEPKTPFNIPLTAHSAKWPLCKGVNSQRSPSEFRRARETEFERLGGSGGAWKQIFDLIEWEAAVFQLDWIPCEDTYIGVLTSPNRNDLTFRSCNGVYTQEGSSSRDSSIGPTTRAASLPCGLWQVA